MLHKSRAEKRVTREPKLTDNGEAFMPDDRSVAESTSTWGVVNVEAADSVDPMEELRTPSSRLPWAISMPLSFVLRLSGSETVEYSLQYSHSKY